MTIAPPFSTKKPPWDFSQAFSLGVGGSELGVEVDKLSGRAWLLLVAWPWLSTAQFWWFLMLATYYGRFFLLLSWCFAVVFLVALSLSSVFWAKKTYASHLPHPAFPLGVADSEGCLGRAASWWHQSGGAKAGGQTHAATEATSNHPKIPFWN